MTDAGSRSVCCSGGLWPPKQLKIQDRWPERPLLQQAMRWERHAG